MYVPKKLMRRPRPYPDESLAGYINRLTESNYYSLPNWIFQMSGLKRRGTYANVFNPITDDLSQLSKIFDVEESILWSMAFSSTNKTKNRYDSQVKYESNFIHIDTLNKHYIKFCPICLQSKAYNRRIWNLSFVTACPFHNCLLVDKCSNCHQHIKWSNPSIVRCKCGFDLRTSQPEFASNTQTALSLHIHKQSSITVLHEETNNILYLDNPLIKLSLNSLIKLLCSFKRFDSIDYLSEKISAKFHIKTSDFKTNKFYFDMVFSLLINWQHEFPVLMSDYKNYLESYNTSFWVKLKPYENIIFLFSTVMRCFSSEEYCFFSNVVENYFWNFLSQISIESIKVLLIKEFQTKEWNAPLSTWKTINYSLAPALGLDELTLAKLFIISQVDIYDNEIFFRINFNHIIPLLYEATYEDLWQSLNV